MKRFSELALKHKLTLLAVAVGLLTLVLASTILLLSEGRRSRELGRAELRSLARVLGATSVAALEFGDARAAQENLTAAGFEGNVLSARLYRADGTPLATYVRAGQESHTPPDRPEAAHAHDQGRYVAILEPIFFRGERSGSIVLEADIGTVAERLRGYAPTVLLAVGLSAAFAIGVAQRLQRAVSTPVERLTAAIRTVAETGDYSLRVSALGRDELALLSGGFNHMLSRIEEQDRALRAKSDELEQRVEERVQEVRREIEERRRTEAALADSERKYRSIVESTNEWIWACDLEGRWTYNNPSVERILGYGPEELLGRRYHELLHEGDREKVTQVLTSPAVVTKGWSGLTLRWRHKDGSYRTLEGIGAPRLDAEGRLTGWQRVDRDITDTLALEQQFRQAQKMEAVGRLAGGVAHDFNNLLGVILGYSDLALRAGVNGTVASRIEQIRSAGERAAALTRQLLAFSRKQVLEPKVLDLNALVLDLGKMLPRLLGEDVALALQPGQGLDRIKADPTQIEQVIMNLAVNARDAMPRGGHLTVRTSNLDVDPAFARAHPPLEPGRYVGLSVTDDGCGMDQATMARIFEPFFTTKEAGKGTGLGLATVYGIVKQSGGYVFAESQPGLGTTFDIYFPCVEAQSSDVSDTGTPPAPRGSETVLLAEDETALRTLIAEILSSLGYRVIAAGSGPEALEAARAEGQSIDLLLTDVVMPGMSGHDLASALRAERPETRILYMTGYTDDAVVRHGVAATGSVLIQKPFTSALLARRVREALAGSRPRSTPQVA